MCVEQSNINLCTCYGSNMPTMHSYSIVLHFCIYMCRSDRERSILNSKVKSLQRQLAEGNVRPPPSQEEERAVGGYSVAELEKVVSSLKKVIERLQSENESLKKSSAVPRPGKAEGGKKTAALLEENNKLKVKRTRVGLHHGGGGYACMVWDPRGWGAGLTCCSRGLLHNFSPVTLACRPCTSGPYQIVRCFFISMTHIRP